MGGLGLRKPCDSNAAFKAKLKWELATDKQKPWTNFFQNQIQLSKQAL